MLFNTINRRSQPSKLPKNFWSTMENSDLSVEDKLVLAYLYTSPLTNRLGYFRCSPIVISKDLKIEVDTVYFSLFSLQHHDFLKFSVISNFIYLTHYLEQFPIKNRNEGKYIENIFKRVFIIYMGNNFPLLLDLTRKLIKLDHLSPLFRKSLKEFFYAIQAVMVEGEKDE